MYIKSKHRDLNIDYAIIIPFVLGGMKPKLANPFKKLFEKLILFKTFL